MDIRQSDFYANYMRSLGWQVEKACPEQSRRAGKANIFIRHFPFFSRWSVIKIQRPESIDYKRLDQIAKTHHALFIKVEPPTNYELQATSYELDSWPLLPTRTLIIDLKKTTLESLPKDTRYEIRKAAQNNLSLVQGEVLPASTAKRGGHMASIQAFYSLLQETMRLGHWSIPIKKEVTKLYESFQPNNSVLLFVNHNPERSIQQPIAACLLIWHNNTAHYMYAALNKKGRETGTAYFLLWETIKFCQSVNKLKYLDLEGVYDPRYPSQTKHWQGFTKFKEGWNGKVVEYPGSYTKYYNPLAKLLFSVAH